MAQKQLNIRVSETLSNDLHRLHDARDDDFQEFISQILGAYVNEQRDGSGLSRVETLDHITQLLADTVARELKRDNKWAAEVVLQARFHLPGESVFGDRVGHYSREKEEIATQFSIWLINRIRERYLAKKRRVCIIIDGGSTLYWVFRKIGEPMKALAREDKEAAKRLSLLSINLPGIESYMSFARLDGRDAAGEERQHGDLLSDIPCHILSGRLEPRYSAVAVENPYERLQEYQARHPETVFIALVTGNWIRIDRRGSFPIPLWHDAEQGEFKRAMIRVAEEVYVVAPLAKVFVGKSIKEINTMLAEVRDEPSNYDDVDEAHDFREKLRLVSTCREKGTLLHDQAVALTAKLDAQLEPDSHHATGVEFKDVPSLLFAFPALRASFSREKQLQWECPHKGTQLPKFLKWAYGM